MVGAIRHIKISPFPSQGSNRGPFDLKSSTLSRQCKAILYHKAVQVYDIPNLYPVTYSLITEMTTSLYYWLTENSGPGCSKLMTSLVNVSLIFQTLISQIRVCQYFLFKKCEKRLHCKSFSHFSTKNFSVFGYKVVKHLTS